MENNESYTEITTKSWGARIADSIKSVLLGVILFLASFVVLWWNEGRAVRTSEGLKEGLSQVISVNPDAINEANDGKLIHISGIIITQDTLRDNEFNIKANALKLKRDVEMYQWVEEEKETKEKQIGGSEKTTTTYEYLKKWVDIVVNSDDFKVKEGHSNPSGFPYSPYTISASEAKIGAFILSSDLISQINEFTPYSLNNFDSQSHRNARMVNEGNGNHGDGIIQKIYIGKGEPANPEIGDVKVSFKTVNSGNRYSIIAKQIKNTFEPFTSKSGISIQMVSPGVVSAEQMFSSAQKGNTITTWILRLIGFLMMFGGISLIFKPLVVLADVLPFLGNLLNLGLSLFSGVVSFGLSLITIALAWIFYRPALGITLLVIAIITAIYLIVKGSKGKINKS